MKVLTLIRTSSTLSTIWHLPCIYNSLRCCTTFICDADDVEAEDRPRFVHSVALQLKRRNTLINTRMCSTHCAQSEEALWRSEAGNYTNSETIFYWQLLFDANRNAIGAAAAQWELIDCAMRIAWVTPLLDIAPAGR